MLIDCLPEFIILYYKFDTKMTKVLNKTWIATCFAHNILQNAFHNRGTIQQQKQKMLIIHNRGTIQQQKQKPYWIM